MKTRLFHQVASKELAKQSSQEVAFLSEEPVNLNHFACLKGNDVIAAKISDHHPIIHDGVLFWNIMMQGKIRNGHTGISYNNGFGIVETEEDYIKRLAKISQVIAEIVHRYPSIDVISLCEGPIQSLHINIFLQSIKKYHSMDKFFIDSIMDDAFHKPNVKGFLNWGLLMLADKRYKVNEVKCDFIEHFMIFEKLANRIQLWKLTKNENIKYLALGHFPFGGDEHTTEKENLSAYGNMYCNLVKDLLNHYANDQFILCADFNLNPYLISEWKDRVVDQIPSNNSMLLTKEGKLYESKINNVTVDGILLSVQEKQKYYSLRFNPGLFSRLVKENNLFQSNIKEHLIENR